jgi:hypothetical protein
MFPVVPFMVFSSSIEGLVSRRSVGRRLPFVVLLFDQDGAGEAQGARRVRVPTPTTSVRRLISLCSPVLTGWWTKSAASAVAETSEREEVVMVFPSSMTATLMGAFYIVVTPKLAQDVLGRLAKIVRGHRRDHVGCLSTTVI